MIIRTRSEKTANEDEGSPHTFPGLRRVSVFAATLTRLANYSLQHREDAPGGVSRRTTIRSLRGAREKIVRFIKFMGSPPQSVCQQSVEPGEFNEALLFASCLPLH